MRRLGSMFGQRKSRNTRSKNQRSKSLATRLSPRFEPLEQRQLLAAAVLASLQPPLTLAEAGDIQELQLTLTGGDSTLIALRMHGLSGTLDPNSISIETLAGHVIAPVESRADVDGSNDSLLLVDLAPGTYSILVRGEGATTGMYNVDVYLPGDISGDGAVSDYEMNWASAAVIQNMGTANQVTKLYYKSLGIDLSKNLYCAEMDTDLERRHRQYRLRPSVHQQRHGRHFRHVDRRLRRPRYPGRVGQRHRTQPNRRRDQPTGHRRHGF